MKTFQQLQPHFVDSIDLEYVDEYKYSNKSLYRGQMKRVEESFYTKEIATRD